MAEGRMQSTGYLVVTGRRLIWDEGRSFLSLTFDDVIRAQEIFEQTHRYRLRLLHEPIARPRERALPWDIPAHVRRFFARRSRDRITELPFSRADTGAAAAIRRALSEVGVTFLAPVVRPHRRDPGVRILSRVGPVRAWWHGRHLSGLD